MIDRLLLLKDLQNLLRRLEADLLERSTTDAPAKVTSQLALDYEKAKTGGRTAQNFEDWRSDAITQMAAAWLISCVFVRFLEDNQLIEPPRIAGPADRLTWARQEYEAYFHQNPTHSDRDYLLSAFDDLETLPGTRDVFGPHNPIRELPDWLSGDAAQLIISFFQKIDPETGNLIHDFTDKEWDTRFLGDLYQDLSEAVRKKYALLQTPVFVEEFILDRTLDPALDEFGLEPAPIKNEDDPRAPREPRFRMIDPACGSGHFLLGAFPRILDRWQKKDPKAKVRELVQRTLDSIFGVDINPYAVAIARFRLLLAAMKACDIHRLDKNVPGFRINLVVGDSLLHAPMVGGQRFFDFELEQDAEECSHAYASEDLPFLKRILEGGQYHAVVANPPYITPKDKLLNDRYRKRFKSCHRQYSLAVPFLERIFGLAVPGGYTGQITANSFMKREFGKKLIESYFPTIDLTHVIDTSGAYIPGHGTPTVILFGRRRPPIISTIRTVMGIRGEPATPEDASKGLVWSAITNQIDQAGSESEFVSVTDSLRELLHKHPWSIGGGGASDLKERLEEAHASKFVDLIEIPIGRAVRMANEEIYMFPPTRRRNSLCNNLEFRELLIGTNVRDWTSSVDVDVWYPYTPLASNSDMIRQLWVWRQTLKDRATFSGTFSESGQPWYEYQQHTASAYRTKLSIVFAFVATHNHFVLDRGGKVFNRSAPVVKLPPDATEEDHLALLGLLNSSTACFWMKQVMNCKGLGGQGGGIKPEHWSRQYEFAGTALEAFPIPPGIDELIDYARKLDSLGQLARSLTPALAIPRMDQIDRAGVDQLKRDFEQSVRQMVALQEDLDWKVYSLYGFVESTNLNRPIIDNEMHPRERPVEILLNQSIDGGNKSIFYEVHSYRGTGDESSRKSPHHEATILQRLELIRKNAPVRFIEQMDFKRRWQVEPWESQLERALREWLLDRLESYFDFDGRMNEKAEPTAKLEKAIVSIARLADIARQDERFLEVGELFRKDPSFDVESLVRELVTAESVPLLPILRYKPSGLIKRGTWERTWDLQRQEDAIDARTKLPASDREHLSEEAARLLKQKEVGTIPVPTKYDSKDFISSDFWRLRGKLDVPKERWISFPHCDGPDGTPVVAWAGYDHLEQARAIAAYYVDVQERFGGRDDPRLLPLLACLVELIPWLKQWHNDPDPQFDGLRMGDYFEGFVADESRQLGKTVQEIKAWVPPAKAKGRAKKRG